jgi:hypothetical protein
LDSLGFSRFRELIDIWESSSKDMDMRAKLNGLLDRSDFSLFFQKGDSFFGAPEESRVIFARLKNPDEDTPEEWVNQASFMAINLDDMDDGRGIQSVFGGKDLPEIKIIDQGKVVDGLVGRKKKPKKK